MSHWRQKAIETFPQLHRAIADAESAAWVWDALRQALQDAYRRKPLDEMFVANVYEYAAWCLHHRSSDVRNAVVFGFTKTYALMISCVPTWAGGCRRPILTALTSARTIF